MKLSLNLNSVAEKLIAERVKSGRYATPEDVVTAALFALQQGEAFENFGPGELDALIAEGDASGPAVEGEKFLAEWRALRTSTKAPGA